MVVEVTKRWIGELSVLRLFPMNNDAQKQNSSVLIYFNIVVWLLCCSCCHYIYVDAGRQVSAYIYFFLALVEKLNDENESRVKMYSCRFFGVFACGMHTGGRCDDYDERWAFCEVEVFKLNNSERENWGEEDERSEVKL